MNDLLVYRCADRPRKSTIPLECRNTAMLADIGFGELIKLQSRNTGLYQLPYLAQHFGGKLPCSLHSLDLTRRLKDNRHDLCS